MKFSFKKKDEDFFTIINEEETAAPEDNEKKVSHTALTADEVSSGFNSNKAENVSASGALDMLKKRIVTAAEEKEKPKPAAAEIYKPKKEAPNQKTEKSLFDKCLPYITDEEGNEADINSEPLYKLQTVAEILKSDSEKALERLSEKYDITFDDLGHTSQYIQPEPKKNVSEKKEELKASKATIKESKDYSLFLKDKEDTEIKKEKNAPAKEVYEETIPLKKVQSNVKSVISDIDISSNIPKTDEASSSTATITFTPISDSQNTSPKLSVSSKTRPIDLTGEIAKLPDAKEKSEEEVHLEKNEFEDFCADEELKSSADSLKFIKKFSIKKRNAFVSTVFSIFLTLLLAFMKLPFMSQLMLSYTKTTMIICAALTGIIILLNLNMFAAIKNIFSRRSSGDICAALASLSTVLYSVFGILNNSNDIIILDTLLLLGIILSFRALTLFFKYSYMLSDIKLMSNKGSKRAVKLINDHAITFAMAKNAIEGDVLIAAPQKTEFVSDYMKYSQFGIFFGGKLSIITIGSLLLSVILGITCAGYFDGLVYGFYAAAAVQCFTALPMLYFIETLPLYRASKKLRRKGGVISGKTAAEHLEMANAVVLDSTDIFPSGTVTLHQMKVLSENNLEDTLVRAASLTESLNSSLAPIFKKIVNSGNIEILPDSDTIKYEDRMGISGWVDNRLLFIGNRTLMEAHGIEVPSVEVDRKILREGFFPVYVATRDKACALLIIKYTVDKETAKELRKLTASGVTLLINSCDPNLIEEMICDYFGLYTDSVKVMTAAGCHLYKNAVTPVKTTSAPAVFKLNPLALITALNCSAKIKRSNILLSIVYVLSLVLGTIIFAYTSLSGSGELIKPGTILLYGIITTAVSYLAYLFTRP